MDSRSKILSVINQNQPAFIPLPDMDFLKGDQNNVVDKFVATLTAIGGKVIPVKTIADIRYHIIKSLAPDTRNITTLPLLGDIMELLNNRMTAPHTLQNIDQAIIEAHFAVAENGAVWITEDKLGTRVLPFICQHLSVIVRAYTILPSMHEAYDTIANDGYGFGTFIAGPSKTADIEQSLVLGAHGSRSMTVFLLD